MVQSLKVNFITHVHVRMYYNMLIYLASQQDKENSDKRKKRQKSTISLNQLKYLISYYIRLMLLLLLKRSLPWPHYTSVDFNEEQYEVARYVFLKVCTYLYVSIYVCICVHILQCMNVCVCVCACMRACVCAWVCACACVCVLIYRCILCQSAYFNLC